MSGAIKSWEQIMVITCPCGIDIKVKPCLKNRKKYCSKLCMYKYRDNKRLSENLYIKEVDYIYKNGIYGRNCSQCGIWYPMDEYPKDSSKKNGKNGRCFSCMRKTNKKYKDSLSPEEKRKRWKIQNNKRCSTINGRLRNNLRSRIHKALTCEVKSKRTMELLGCSIEHLRKHLESQFKPGMDWDNYSLSGWHIDHIKPCNLFDLTNIEEQKQCFNYKNLQPLWAEDNLKKGCKV